MRYILVYGGLAGVIVITIIALGLAFAADVTGNMWFGYLVMLVVLSLIFIGVKRFRDIERGGVITFGRAFMIGLGMAVVAGLSYVVAWEISLAATDYAFIDTFTAAAIADLRTLPPAELRAQIAAYEDMQVQYANPLIRLPMTFLEILPVGVIVALISAGLLRNPRFLPARAQAVAMN